jgi:hypothetical protein
MEYKTTVKLLFFVWKVIYNGMSYIIECFMNIYK